MTGKGTGVPDLRGGVSIDTPGGPKTLLRW